MIEGESKNVLFEGGPKSSLAAARWRVDRQWGFECMCGNYDLLAEQEKPDLDKLLSGSPSRIVQIAEMLKAKPQLRFKMESINGLPSA